MTHQDLRDRTKKLAIAIILFSKSLPKTDEVRIISKQIIRCATSVAANYRAACKGRSDAEFYAKLCIVVEEADETQFWLELLQEANLVSSELIRSLYKEAGEILAIMTSSKKTLSLRIKK